MGVFSLKFSMGRWPTLRRRMVEIFSVLLLVALIAGPLSMLGWLVFFTDTFAVEAITVVDARPHTTEAVAVIGESTMGQNMLFIQTPLLERRVLAELPQVRDVHILRKLPGTLKIIIQEKEPALLLLSSATYYLVDDQGIAYEQASLDTLPGTPLPIIKNSDQTASVALGNPVLDAKFVSFVREAAEKLPDIAGAEVAEIRVPSLAAREVHVLFLNNWLIRFDTTRPLATQLDVLERLLEHTITEEEQAVIEYIDLRIPSRVYYKLRGT